MNSSAALAVAFMAICFSIGIFDVWVTYINVGAETVSSVLGRWGSAFPILPMLVGLVLGHVFWPRHPSNGPGPGSP